MIASLARRARPPLVHAGRGRAARLALTFDDGPSEWTPALLDVLADAGAPATFFVLGAAVAGREDVLRRAVGDGHELGSHGFGHADPETLTDDALRDDLRRAADAIRAAVDRPVSLVRPPYLGDARRFARVAAELGLAPTVLASVDPSDWRESDPELIAGRVLERVRPGAIVDLHDGVPPRNSGTRTRLPTVEAVALLVPRLQAQGYRFCTVSDLLR